MLPALENTQTHTNRNTLKILSMYSCTVNKADTGGLCGITDSKHVLFVRGERNIHTSMTERDQKCERVNRAG